MTAADAATKFGAAFQSARRGNQILISGLDPTVLGRNNDYAYFAATAILKQSYGRTPTQKFDFEEKQLPNALERTMQRLANWNR